MSRICEEIKNIKDRWINFLMEDDVVEHIMKFAKNWGKLDE